MEEATFEFKGLCVNTLTTGYNGTLNIVGDIYEPPPSIYFGNNQEKGRLCWEDNVLKFEGNASESANLFIELLTKKYAEYNEEQRKKAQIEVLDEVLSKQCDEDEVRLKNVSPYVSVSDIEKIRKEARK